MTWYNVVNGYIIPCDFKGKTADYVRKMVPRAVVFDSDVDMDSTVYDSVKKFIPIEEDIQKCDWFKHIELAILKSIGMTRSWDVLQDEAMFDSYVKERVR